MRVTIYFFLSILILGSINVDSRSLRRLREYPNRPHVLTQFQTNTTIIAGSGGSTASDIVNIWYGTQSNQITAGNASSVFYSIALPSTINVCADSIVRFTYFMKNQAQVLNLQSLSLYLGTSLSRYAQFEFGSYGIRDSTQTYWGKWNHYYASIKKFVPTGTYRCDSINFIIVEPKGNVGVIDTISIGEVSTFSRRIVPATVIFNVDDNIDDWRVYGAPKLDSLCMDYTMLVNGGTVGTSLYMTEKNLDDLYFRSNCSKPDIGPHLWNHDNVTTLTTDSAMSSLRRSQTWIRGRGWCQAGQCAVTAFAYPYGAKSHKIDSLFRLSGLMDWARVARDYDQGETQQFNDPFGVRPMVTLGNTYDTIVTKAMIDTLIAHRGTGVIVVHKIQATGCTETAATWCQPKWLALVNYIQTKVLAGTLQVKSVGDYLEQYGGGYGPARKAGTGR